MSIGPLIYPLEQGSETSYSISNVNNLFSSDPNCPLIIDLRNHDEETDTYLIYTGTNIVLDEYFNKYTLIIS